MHSCLYQGKVRHCRRSPVRHTFTNRLFMVYVDLAELPRLRRFGITRRRWGLASLCESDHLFADDGGLDAGVRAFVARETGMRPEGPIRLLTQLRYLGHYFSPLNLFYCFDVNGTDVQCIVAEVSNTPWNERHAYVLWEGNRSAVEGDRYRHPKAFHVSPFMEMEAEYHWGLKLPGDRLAVCIRSERDGECFFSTSLRMRRRPLRRTGFALVLARHPLITVQILAAIYWQALRLWWKRCPFYSHPDKIESAHTG